MWKRAAIATIESVGWGDVVPAVYRRGMAAGMPLKEFIAHWNDPDPWAVPKHEWHARFAQLGLPQRSFVLTDPEIRAMYLADHPEMAAQPATTASPAPSIVGEMSRKIARVVRWRRVMSGLGLSQISRATGIHRSTLSRIERERRSPTIDELERIAKALDYPLMTLLERARSQPLD